MQVLNGEVTGNSKEWSDRKWAWKRIRQGGGAGKWVRLGLTWDDTKRARNGRQLSITDYSEYCTSYALEPVFLATSCAPPHACSSCLHCCVVLESIQIGEWGSENQPWDGIGNGEWKTENRRDMIKGPPVLLFQDSNVLSIQGLQLVYKS